MAGASKQRAKREKQQAANSSEGMSSSQPSGGRRESDTRSTPQSIGAFDGNQDPQEISYQNPVGIDRDPATSNIIIDGRRLEGLGVSGYGLMHGVSHLFHLRFFARLSDDFDVLGRFAELAS